MKNQREIYEALLAGGKLIESSDAIVTLQKIRNPIP